MAAFAFSHADFDVLNGGCLGDLLVDSVLVLKLVASCCWNCGMDKLLNILEMKTLHRQPDIEAAAYNVHLYKFLRLMHSFHHLSSSLMAINFISVSPTGSVPSKLPLTPHKELWNNLLEARTFDDADLWHWHVLNAIYRRLSRQSMINPHTEAEQWIPYIGSTRCDIAEKSWIMFRF